MYHEALTFHLALSPHAPIRAPTSSYGCLFFLFLSNLIISPLILRGWGRTLFCSNQIKPRTREHGWAHAWGAGKSRSFPSAPRQNLYYADERQICDLPLKRGQVGPAHFMRALTQSNRHFSKTMSMH